MLSVAVKILSQNHNEDYLIVLRMLYSISANV